MKKGTIILLVILGVNFIIDHERLWKLQQYGEQTGSNKFGLVAG
jgi:hypothetical protein